MPDHPTSPVANEAKFLTVFGTVFPNRPMTTRPIFTSPWVTSKKTCKRKHVDSLYKTNRGIT